MIIAVVSFELVIVISKFRLLKPNGHYMYRTVVTIGTTRFHSPKILHSAHTVHLCLLCGSEPRGRWEDNIKMDLQEVGGGRGNWMELAQDRDGWRALVGTVRNFRFP